MNVSIIKYAIRLGSILSMAATVSFGATSIPTRAQLGGDFVNWGNSGNEFAYLVNGFSATTNGGLNLSITGSSYDFIRYDEGSAWTGNFAIGDNLLYTDWFPTTIDITFATAVLGAGAQIQTELYTDFTATLSAYNSLNVLIGTHNFSGVSDTAGDNSAVFAGILSENADIKRIVFTADDDEGVLGFAINQLQVKRQSSIPSVPDNGVNVGFALAALVAFASWSRRRSAN
jgi:MYXO-CTERM domain-containing protein